MEIKLVFTDVIAMDHNLLPIFYRKYHLVLDKTIIDIRYISHSNNITPLYNKETAVSVFKFGPEPKSRFEWVVRARRFFGL